MAVRLGTVAPVGFDDFADPAWLGCFRQLGCHSVQVYRNRHGNDASHSGEVTTRQIKEYLAAAELPCDSIHGLYGNDLDPSSPDETVRRAAVETFKSEGQLALELGGPLVVVHCSGVFPGQPSAEDKRIRYDQLRKSVEELGEFAQVSGIRYAFENLPPYHAVGSDVGKLAEMLRDINLPSIGMCFDVAHANLAGDPVAAAALAGDVMSYVHICDNNGLTDDHLMPFCGEIDWLGLAKQIAEANFDGVLMLETFYKLEQLRKLIDEGLGEKLAEFLTAAGG
ncbi:MAG: sugar phosphate isomerase/epimerase [Phycisphaerae bacterium]|nr:sugar phosphate isomerase/epimerase [Phycisphaerae bacterium]